MASHTKFLSQKVIPRDEEQQTETEELPLSLRIPATRRLLLLGTITAALLSVVVLLLPMPSGGRVKGAMFDLVHAPLFLLLALAFLRATGSASLRCGIGRALSIWLLLGGLAFLTEWAQGLVGRNASWQDAWSDVIGATMGVVWYMTSVATLKRKRFGVWLCCVVLLTTAWFKPIIVLVDASRQRLEMPRIASFEHLFEMTRWQGNDCRITRVRRHATEGSWALLLELEPGVYPGVTLCWPPSDWSRYEQLVFDLTLEDGPPLDLVVKIEDAYHNGEYRDRFHRVLRLTRGTQEYCLPLEDVANAPDRRRLDLSNIAKLQFFAVKLDRRRNVHLDNIRLCDRGEDKKGASTKIEDKKGHKDDSHKSDRRSQPPGRSHVE